MQATYPYYCTVTIVFRSCVQPTLDVIVLSFIKKKRKKLRNFMRQLVCPTGVNNNQKSVCNQS